MNQFKRLLIGTVGLALFATTGCALKTSEKEPATAQKPAANEKCTKELKGGTVTMGTGQAAQTLDPVTQNSGGNGGSERAALYDTLMRYDPETNEYSPHLAESLVGNDDSTKWTLVLREGIKFPTGDLMTAEVVKQSIERHTAKGSSTNLSNILDFVKTMEVVDERTLVFHLSEPYGTFPFLLAGSGGEITNPAVVKQLGAEFGRKAVPGLGVGPYDVVKFAPGEEIVLKAKDDYWGGPVCIDKLRFVHIPGGQATYDAFKLDEVQIALLTDARAVDAAIKDGVKGFTSTSYGGGAVLLNSGARGSKPETADVRIREAITLAINPEVMNQRRWDGLGMPSPSLVHPPDAPLYPGVKGPAYDAARAKKLVTELKAGGWDGQLRLVCPNDPSNVEGSIAITALLDSVGIKVDASQVTTADLINAVIIDGNYDMACWGIGAQSASPFLAVSGFHSGSTENYSGFKDPAMDVAIDKLQAAASVADQRSALGEIQTVWNKTYPAAVYASPRSLLGHSDKVHGLTATSWGTLLFHNAYVD